MWPSAPVMVKCWLNLTITSIPWYLFTDSRCKQSLVTRWTTGIPVWSVTINKGKGGHVIVFLWPPEKPRRSFLIYILVSFACCNVTFSVQLLSVYFLCSETWWMMVFKTNVPLSFYSKFLLSFLTSLPVSNSNWIYRHQRQWCDKVFATSPQFRQQWIHLHPHCLHPLRLILWLF